MEIERGRRHLTIRPRRGGVVFVPANAWNRPTWTRPVKVLHFLFGPRHIGISLVEHDASGPARVGKTSLPAIGGALHEVLNALTLLPGEASAGEVGPLLVQALLIGVARSLRTPQTVRARKGRNTYDRICLYMQEHFHQEITRDSVAAEFHLNPNHLSRLFRREGLMRFTDYLAWVRVDRAKYLLKHHDIMLDELARSCGFKDTAYFCRVFKRRTNQTPVRYRLKARD
jgi:AraC-like DNA-binding protein